MMIHKFSMFNIPFVPRSQYLFVHPLATKSSMISPLGDYEGTIFTIEFMYILYVPDNVTNWRVFELINRYYIYLLMKKISVTSPLMFMNFKLS
jgi:hypothetical protein